MEAFFAGILFGLLITGLPLVVVAAVGLWAAIALDVRVLRLEKHLRSLPSAKEVAADAVAPSAPAVAPTVAAAVPETPPIDSNDVGISVVKPSVSPAEKSASPLTFEALWSLVERSLVWVGAAIGALMLFLASIFVLLLSLERGWFGPAAQVGAGLGAGAALAIAGLWLRRSRFAGAGSALLGAGLGAWYASLFAATSVYYFLPSWLGFALMSAVTAVGLAGAMRQRSRFVAHLALLGGLATPALLSTGTNQPVGLFSYLTLLSLGAVVGAVRLGWFDLAAVAGLGAAALHVGWSISWYSADQRVFALGGWLALAAVFVGLRASPRWTNRATSGALVTLFAAISTVWLAPLADRVTGPAALAAWAKEGWDEWLAAVVFLAFAGMILATVGRLSLRWGDGVAWIFVTVLTAAMLPWAAHPLTLAYPLVTAIGALSAVAALRAGEARGWALSVPWVGLGLGLGIAALLDPSGPALRAGSFALLGVSAFSALRARGGAAGALVGSALVSYIGLLALREHGVGVALLALSLTQLSLFHLGFGALTRPWPGALWVSALSPVLLLLPLVWAFEQVLGTAVWGLVPLTWGATAALLAFALRRRKVITRESGIYAAYLSVASFGAAVALPLQWEAQWLTVGWAVEASALAWLSRRLGHRLLSWFSLALSLVVGTRLLVNPAALAYGSAEGWPLLNWTLLTWGLPAVALLAASRALPDARSDIFGRFEASFPMVLRLLAIFLGFALVNAEVSHAFQDAGPLELGGSGVWQGMARTASWALYGVGLLTVGLNTGSRTVRFLGFGFVLLATVKVFVVDSWAFSGLVRVGSFAALGVALIVAAALFERLVLRRETR